MCEIKDVQTIYSFMKIKGIGVARTNKEILSYSQQVSFMPSLEDCLLSVLSDKQKEEYYTHYETIGELKIKSQEVFFKTVLDDSYPVTLRNLLKLNTPPVLYMVGNIGLLSNRKIGLSGSRKVSEKGIAVTRDCVEQLSEEKNLSIVSGYAQGVDKEAHYTALKSGGSTIVVLPNGISSFYIRQDLKDVWDWNRVLVISEYLPDDGWTAGRAMNCNNTIIGQSDSMVVIEAGMTGGSLDAGLRTSADNKPLFVPIYSNYPESAQGNRLLLERGATGIRRNRQSNRANVLALL